MFLPGSLVYYFISKAVSGVAGAVFVYMGYRILGVSTLGQFSYIFSGNVIFVALISTWVKQAFLRFLAR
jgi:hypothetical protein